MTDNTNTNADDDTSGLKANNAELLKKLKAEKDARKTLEERLQVLEDERDQAQSDAAAKAGDVDTIKAQLEAKHAKEIKALTDGKSALEVRLSELLIDNEIKTAITANNVLPQFAPAVTALLKNGAALKDGVAMAGDVPLADRITAFMSGEEGKYFVAEPVNSGSGAQSSSTAVKGHGYTKENFNSRLGEWAALEKTNPDEARAIAASVGRSDLAKPPQE